VILTFDPKIYRVPLLPLTDVWTKVGQGVFELLIRNEKGYRRTDQPTDMCKAIKIDISCS